MKKKQIAGTDLIVAPINLGGNVFGWTINETQSFEILDGFTDAGFNFIDTADTYSWWAEGNIGGESETIIGKWLHKKKNRDQLIIATKVGSENRDHKIDISRKHILKSIDESLRRLQTDYIDLYYTHFDDGVTPIEETLSTYNELIQSGKIRYIAASNIAQDRFIESMELAKQKGLPEYKALQLHYNLVERDDYEKNFAPLAEKYNLSVFSYWSLASGFLTGKYRSIADLKKSVRGESVAKYLNKKGLDILNVMDQIAAKHNSKLSSIALAWLLAQPHVVAPIVSATNLDQLQTLLVAPDIILDAEELNLLNDISK